MAVVAGGAKGVASRTRSLGNAGGIRGKLKALWHKKVAGVPVPLLAAVGLFAAYLLYRRGKNAETDADYDPTTDTAADYSAGVGSGGGAAGGGGGDGGGTVEIPENGGGGGVIGVPPVPTDPYRQPMIFGPYVQGQRQAQGIKRGTHVNRFGFVERNAGRRNNGAASRELVNREEQRDREQRRSQRVSPAERDARRKRQAQESRARAERNALRIKLDAKRVGKLRSRNEIGKPRGGQAHGETIDQTRRRRRGRRYGFAGAPLVDPIA